MGIVGCYQQTCSEQNDTDGGVLGRGHVGSWASCAEREKGSLECWRLESCSGRKPLKREEETSEDAQRKVLTFHLKVKCIPDNISNLRERNRM